MRQAQLHEEDLSIRRRVRGPDHVDTLISITNMGTLLYAQGNFADTVGLMALMEPAVRTAFTGSHIVRLGRFLTPLGRARAALGDYETAEFNLTEAYAILSEARGATDRDRADLLMSLIQLYEAWNAAEPGQGYDEQAADWRGHLLP